MKGKLSHVLWSGWLLIGSMSPATAAIVDHGNYLPDTESGLDWLDVTLTIRKSYNYVLTQFGPGGEFEGWRYATGAELNELISHHTATTITSTSYVIHAEGPIDSLVTMLGSTLDAYEIYYTGNTWDFNNGYAEGSGVDYTRGFIADSVAVRGSSVPYQWDAAIEDCDAGGPDPSLCPDYSRIYYQKANPASFGFTGGSFLVRDTAYVPPAPVPLPAAALLFGLGIAGLGLFRRRHK